MRRAGLIDILYWLRRWTRRVLRLRSRGVKVLLFNARGEVALIRNTYGNRDQFVLPGGGIRWHCPQRLFTSAPFKAAGLRMFPRCGDCA